MASKIPISVTKRGPTMRRDSCSESVITDTSEDKPKPKSRSRDSKYLPNGHNPEPKTSRVDASMLAELPNTNKSNYKNFVQLRKTGQGSAPSRIPVVGSEHGSKYISNLRKKMTKKASEGLMLRKYAAEQSDSQGEESSISTCLSDDTECQRERHVECADSQTVQGNSKARAGSEHTRITGGIPAINIQADQESTDDQRTILTNQPSKSGFSPRKKMTFQQQQQISTKRLLITRQKSLDQIKIENNRALTAQVGQSNDKARIVDGRKKVRVRILTAKSSTSTTSSSGYTSMSLSRDELDMHRREQELLDSVRVDRCLTVEGPVRPVIPGGASDPKAVDPVFRLARYVYKVPGDGYFAQPSSRRESASVVNLDLSLDDHKASTPRLPLGLLKIQVKQHAISINPDDGKSDSRRQAEIKTVRVSGIPVSRERHAVNNYNRVDVFRNDTVEGQVRNEPSTSRHETENNLAVGGTNKRVKFRTSKSALNSNQGKITITGNGIQGKFPQRSIKTTHPESRVKLYIKTEPRRSQSDSSIVSMKVMK